MWYNNGMAEGSPNLRPIIIGLGALAVIVVIGLVFVFNPKPTRLAQPLIDPALSARLSTEVQAASRAYAEFQQKYPPEKIQQLERDFAAKAQALQLEQTQSPP